MPDDVSTGELSRRQDAHELRTAEQHRAIDQRITDVAAQSLPIGVWQQAERARDLETKDLRDDIKTINDARGMTFGKWVGVLTVVAAFLGVVLTAYLSKGAK